MFFSFVKQTEKKYDCFEDTLAATTAMPPGWGVIL
jgi:hypothetical protein